MDTAYTLLVIPCRCLLRTFADRVVGSGGSRHTGETGGNHDVNIFGTLPKGKFEDLSPLVPHALTNARQKHFGTVSLQVMMIKPAPSVSSTKPAPYYLEMHLDTEPASSLTSVGGERKRCASHLLV